MTLGTGDGVTARFQLIKRYGDVVRPITRPVSDTIKVAVNGVLVSHTLEEGGVIVIDPPTVGGVVTAGFLFDVPVRFDTDGLTLALDTHGAISVSDVPLIEIFEETGYA